MHRTCAVKLTCALDASSRGQVERPRTTAGHRMTERYILRVFAAGPFGLVLQSSVHIVADGELVLVLDFASQTGRCEGKVPGP